MRSPNRRSAVPPRLRRLSRAGLLLSLGLLLTACSGAQSAIDPEGPYAQDPHNLFMLTFWIAVVVFVLVQGLIIFTAVKYRAKAGDDTAPVQTHGNTKLEIFWTVVPALILAGIAVPTVQQIFDLAEEPEGALTVEVIGHRWWWEYRYPDTGIITANELVIPTDRPIRLEMTAEDNAVGTGVLHSYWIPALAGKQDVVPGRTVTLNMQADEPGRYLGQCAEYCGLSHANMRNRAVAMSPDAFRTWVQEQQQGAEVPQEGTIEAQGREVFGNSCATCHVIREDGVSSAEDYQFLVGPDLTHLMSRKEFAGAIFDLYKREDPDDPNSAFTDEPNVEQLRAWVRDAPSMKAMRPETGFSMRSFTDLSDEDLDAVVAYLLTLQ